MDPRKHEALKQARHCNVFPPHTTLAMNDEQYLSHYHEMLTDLTRGPRITPAPCRGRHAARTAGGFERLADSTGDLYTDAAPLVDRLFTTYPDLAPTLPRELLWFLGGDCLHFMPDDEIALFQQLDDLRSQEAAGGDTLDIESARSSLRNPH